MTNLPPRLTVTKWIPRHPFPRPPWQPSIAESPWFWLLVLGLIASAGCMIFS